MIFRHDLQINCKDLTLRKGTRIGVSVMATMTTSLLSNPVRTHHAYVAAWQDWPSTHSAEHFVESSLTDPRFPHHWGHYRWGSQSAGSHWSSLQRRRSGQNSGRTSWRDVQWDWDHRRFGSFRAQTPHFLLVIQRTSSRTALLVETPRPQQERWPRHGDQFEVPEGERGSVKLERCWATEIQKHPENKHEGPLFSTVIETWIK